MYKSLIQMSLWLALAFGMGSAAAQAQSQLSGSLSISELINRGEIARAESILLEADASPVQLRFFQGQVAKARGQFYIAIDIFREVLAQTPGFLNARRELAHTLMLAQRWTAASIEFNSLLWRDPSARMREGYRKFLNIIEDNRPLAFHAEFAIVPSSNVNRGSMHEKVTAFGQSSWVISESSQAQTGTGLRYGFGVNLRLPLSRRGRFVLGTGFSDIRYKEKEFNALTRYHTLNYEYRAPKLHLSFGPYLNTIDRTGTGDATLRGARLVIVAAPNAREKLQFSLRREDRWFEDAKINDGFFSSGDISYTRSWQSGLSLTGGLVFEESRPEGKHLRFRGRGYKVSLGKTWRSGLRLGLGFQGGERDYEGNFATINAPREDAYATLTFDALYNKWQLWGAAPKLSCSYTRNYSNIEFYDYDVRECTLAITRRF